MKMEAHLCDSGSYLEGSDFHTIHGCLLYKQNDYLSDSRLQYKHGLPVLQITNVVINMTFVFIYIPVIPFPLNVTVCNKATMDATS